MCEVIKSNFEALFPFIEKAIKQCEFVALDTEFTGLQLDESCKPSLFDTSEDRYLKLRRSFTHFTISQIGLSAFVNINENKYEAHTFNFYLFPHAFGSSDVRFTIQASSFSFLTKHNFDFNKFVYEGVPYLNMEEELKLKEDLSRKTMFSGLEREVDEEEIQCICSEIAEWFVRSKKHETYKVENNSDTNKINAYLLHTEIRKRFPDVWTYSDEADNIIVEHVTASQRSELEDLDLDTRKHEEQKLVQTMLGFTRVFRLLQDFQKPVVGHNMLSDLMLVYDKFYKPLPEKFSDFKKELCTVLPRIYDTKHMAVSAKKDLAGHVAVDKTSLKKIYQMFNSKEVSEAVLFSPCIQHAASFNLYKDVELPHEAGYDAFMCGSVFLKLAHILSRKQIRSMDIKPCRFNLYVSHLHPFLNRVNIIRATINHVRLDGEDPESQRPEILFVKSKKTGFKLTSEQLAKWFSPYGKVDVKLQGSNRGLVATGNHACAKDILRSFRRHDRIYVRKYNVWKHSPLVTTLLWTGALTSAAVCIGVLISSFKTR